MNNFLKRDIKNVRNRCPLLATRTETKQTFLEGEIEFLDTNSKVCDSFFINIQIPETYPNCFPKVYETEKRIPRIPDRHINPGGEFCLTVEQVQQISVQKGIDILLFIDKFVVPFLSNQIFYELYGYFPEEYQHGKEGIIQFLQETLSTNNSTVIKAALSLSKKRTEWPGRNEKCFCESGLKFKKCHWSAIIVFYLLPKDAIEKYIKIME